MATTKNYTDIEQSMKLAEILPLESADMVLSFRHTKNDEYIPGYVVSRNYVEVYNEMAKLPGMEKKDVCQLIQPVWSLAALLDVLPKEIIYDKNIVYLEFHVWEYSIEYVNNAYYTLCVTKSYDNPIDACVDMIIKLHEMNLL